MGKKTVLTLRFLLFTIFIIFLSNLLYSSNIKGKIYFNINVGYNLLSPSFKEERSLYVYEETENIIEEYKTNPGITYGIDIGFGVFSHLSLSLSAEEYKGKLKGDFSAAIPHPVYYDKHRNINWMNENLNYKEQTLSLNLDFYLNPKSSIVFYVSAGVTYFKVRFQNMDYFIWEETPPYDAVESYDAVFDSYNSSAIGFNAGFGTDCFITKHVALCFKGKFSLGEVEYKLQNGEKNKFNAGGLRIITAIKILI